MALGVHAFADPVAALSHVEDGRHECELVVECEHAKNDRFSTSLVAEGVSS